MNTEKLKGGAGSPTDIKYLNQLEDEENMEAFHFEQVNDKKLAQRRERGYPAIDQDDEAFADIEAGKPNPFIFVITVLVSFSGFLFGYDTGYISSALTSIGTDLGGHQLSDGDESLITSATSLGALLGGIIAGSIADAIGRKWVTLFANTLFVVGAAVQTGSHEVWPMIGGRFIMGWGVGIASLVAPLYLSEMAPSRFRGRLVILNVLAITSGQVIAYAIGAGLAHVHNGWRIQVGLSMLPALVQTVIFVFMPETPRYLVQHNKIDQARKVIRFIYTPGGGVVLPEAVVERKIRLLQQYSTVLVGPDENPTFFNNLKAASRKLYGISGNFRALVIACGLQGIQQLSGFNSLMYFSSSLFQTVGFDNPTAVSLIISGTNMAFTIVAFLLIDLIGRRRILLCSIPIMAGALVLAAIAFHFLPDNATGANPWAIIILISMMVYVASYASGIGNVPWQQSELFPIEVRGLGTSMSTMTNWGGNLIISSTYLKMMDSITPSGTFGFFAAMCACGWIFVLMVYPETAYLTLESVQVILKEKFDIKLSYRMSAAARREFREEALRKKDHSEHKVTLRKKDPVDVSEKMDTVTEITPEQQ
ncbi:uncharacterized protein V1516DRAFT_681225 [Lipomyces oligophaga]|uniref:uncharacterized protein n=1 Tax=Lipomyces oligophaga TaxID=45792 RepID=UPI0034CE7B00